MGLIKGDSMQRKEILKSVKLEIDISVLEKEIEDLNHDARVVKSKFLISVIRNSIKAKQEKLERLKNVQKALRVD